MATCLREADPVTFDATGYYGSTFSYNQSPNPWGSTAPLTGYDKYTIDLYVDFALIGLTFEGAPILIPPGDYNNNYVVDAADYVVWRQTDGTPANYDIWRANFGQAAGAGAAIESVENASIPEPATFAILLGGIVALFPRWPSCSVNSPYRTHLRTFARECDFVTRLERTD